jgi:hypothetical protein
MGVPAAKSGERLQILFADDQASSGSFELESVWLEGSE